MSEPFASVRGLRKFCSCKPQVPQSPYPPCSLVRDERTHPHRPRLVVYHSTCRPLSSSPPREQRCNRSCSNKHTQYRVPHGSQSAWWLGLAPATLEFWVLFPGTRYLILEVPGLPATLEFWVRFPNERNQGKQAHPVLKYPVPHGSQARPPPSPPRPPPSHMHAGWMVSATKTPTSSAPSQGRPF